jgi:hypothetical protein
MGTRTLPSFDSLGASYPDERSPCEQGWSNQCAIRLSIALTGAGFALTAYTEPKCRHGHARGAESLANYLWRQVNRPRIFAATGERGCEHARGHVSGRTGVVLFRNITGFRGGIGDHIDLWDGTATMTGEYFGVSQQVWFWEAR